MYLQRRMVSEIPANGTEEVAVEGVRIRGVDPDLTGSEDIAAQAVEERRVCRGHGRRRRERRSVDDEVGEGHAPVSLRRAGL